jgi:hypothetical protein
VDAMSNRNLISLDQIRAKIGWIGLLELTSLQGPVLSFDYQLGYRFADDNRLVALTRHDLMAQIRWPVFGAGTPWLLGLSADLYYVSGRSWANAVGFSLQYGLGEQSYRNYRPSELPLADYISGTSWRN